jgi:hypothetical protein
MSGVYNRWIRWIRGREVGLVFIYIVTKVYSYIVQSMHQTKTLVKFPSSPSGEIRTAVRDNKIMKRNNIPIQVKIAKITKITKITKPKSHVNPCQSHLPFPLQIPVPRPFAHFFLSKSFQDGTPYTAIYICNGNKSKIRHNAGRMAIALSAVIYA